MSDALKLEALVRRATENGWEGRRFFVGSSPENQAANHYEIWTHYSKNDFLFNHDFARALFGDEPSPYGKVWQRIEPGKGVEYAVQNGYVPAWQYHLQQAVISEDPIGYMYKAVFDE